MMMANDRGDLGVGIDVGQNPLPDFGVTLHLAPLVERQRAGLLEQSWRQPDLADVVNETAQVSQLLPVGWEPHPNSDVSGIHCDRGRVAGGISVPCIDSR